MRRGLIAALLIALAAIGGVIIGNSTIADPAASQPSVTIAPERANSPFNENGRETLTSAQLLTATRAGVLPAGTKSLLATTGRMRHGDYKWDEKGVAPGKITIWVDLRTQLISVFRGGHEIGTSVIVYGADTMQSPTGIFPILSKHRDYHSRTYDAPMPYSLFITNTGVALHGSPMSSRRATHGCIGLPLDFARLLFAAANQGDEVQITRSNANPLRGNRREAR